MSEFTPQQTEEIRRIIEQQVLVSALSYKIHAPTPPDAVKVSNWNTPPDAEKGDLERAADEVLGLSHKEHTGDAFWGGFRHGITAAAGHVYSMLPGRDLARAKEAERDAAYWKDSTFNAAKLIAEVEAKLAKMAASRKSYRDMCYELAAFTSTSGTGWRARLDAIVAFDKEDNL